MQKWEALEGADQEKWILKAAKLQQVVSGNANLGKVERGKVVNGEGGKEGAEAGKVEGNGGVVGGGD